MENNYGVAGGTISVEKGQRFCESRKKFGNGFTRELVPCKKLSLELSLNDVPKDKWPSVYSWLNNTLSSTEAFDGSSENYSYKRIYVIANFEGLEPRGFCSISKAGQGKIQIRKISSILSSKGIGRKVGAEWPAVQRQLEEAEEFRYKEEVFSHPEEEVSLLEGTLDLWKGGNGLQVRSIYDAITQKSELNKLFDGLDIYPKYF